MSTEFEMSQFDKLNAVYFPCNCITYVNFNRTCHKILLFVD